MVAVAVLHFCFFSDDGMAAETYTPVIFSDFTMHIPVLDVQGSMFSIDLEYHAQGPADGIWFKVTGGQQTDGSNCSNPPALFLDQDLVFINFPVIDVIGQPYWAVMQVVSARDGLWLELKECGPLARRIFQTSVKGTGNLSTWPDAHGKTGIEAGDAICQSRADAAGLSGTFVAWLSDDNNDAYCRLHQLSGKKADNCGLSELPVDGGPWVRTDGFPFASDAAHLFGRNVVYSTVTTDEFGIAHLLSGGYFTATTNQGTVYKNEYATTCDNWTNSPEAMVGGGVAVFGAGSWSNGSTGYCNMARALLCIETGSGPPIHESYKRSGKKIFLSSIQGNGNLSSWHGAGGKTGIAAGDSICQTLAREAGLENAEHFKAWLSDTHTSAFERIQSDGPWVRMDGIRIADNRQGLKADNLPTVLNLTEKGDYIASGASAWTGTLRDMQPDTQRTCNDWQTDSSESNGRVGRTFDTESWTTSGYPSCNYSFYLYCIED